MKPDEVRRAAEALDRIAYASAARHRLAADSCAPDRLPWTEFAGRIRPPLRVAERLGSIIREALDHALLEEIEAAELVLRDLDVEPPARAPLPAPAKAWGYRGEAVEV